MSEEPQGPDTPPAGAEGRAPSEEELRQMMEEQVKRLRIEDVIAESAVSMINLGARRAGLVPGSEDERDPEQVRDAIDASDALVAVLERSQPQHVAPLRDALAQLKLAYARIAPHGAPVGAEGGSQAAAPPGGQEQEKPGPGTARSSGRLWIPGD